MLAVVALLTAYCGIWKKLHGLIMIPVEFQLKWICSIHQKPYSRLHVYIFHLNVYSMCIPYVPDVCHVFLVYVMCVPYLYFWYMSCVSYMYSMYLIVFIYLFYLLTDIVIFLRLLYFCFHYILLYIFLKLHYIDVLFHLFLWIT